MIDLGAYHMPFSITDNTSGESISSQLSCSRFQYMSVSGVSSETSSVYGNFNSDRFIERKSVLMTFHREFNRPDSSPFRWNISRQIDLKPDLLIHTCFRKLNDKIIQSPVL